MILNEKSLNGVLALACGIVFSAGAGASEVQQFVWDGSLQSQVFTLETIKKHPIYKDVFVPRTCTKEEIVGYDTVCTPTTRRVCDPVTRRVCRDEPRSVCHPVTRRECSSHPVCQDVTDQVCRTNPGGGTVCTPITRRVCHDENVCRDVYDQVCETHYETVCEDVSDEVCRDVPDTVCEEVPRTRTVEYDCSTTEQEQVGEEEDYRVQATVHVNFVLDALSLAAGKVDETFQLQLKDTEVQLNALETSKNFLLFANAAQAVRDAGPRLKTVDAVIAVKALAVEPLVKAFAQGLQNVHLESGILSFRFPKVAFGENMRFYLRLMRSRFLVSSKGVFDGIIDESAIERAEGAEFVDYRVHLDKLSLAEKMKNKPYEIVLEAAWKRPNLGQSLNEGLMNEVLRASFKDKLRNE